MLFVRLLAILFVIFAFILLGLFVYTQERKYLLALKKTAIYTAWLLILMLLMALFSRVLRL